MKIDGMSFNIITAINEAEYIGGDLQKNAAIQVKFNELLIALHDAIERPKGVVPDSADKFYCHEYYKKPARSLPSN